MDMTTDFILCHQGQVNGIFALKSQIDNLFYQLYGLTEEVPASPPEHL